MTRTHAARAWWTPAATLLGVAAITLLCWLATPPSSPISHAAAIGQLVGAWAMAGFAVLFLATTRHPLIDVIVNGADKAYRWHMWVGAASISLVVLHLVIVTETSGTRQEEDPFHALGLPSMIGFVILTAIGVLTSRMEYDRWKHIHRWLVLPYLIGVIHYVGSSAYAPLGLTPLSVWMGLVILAGMSAAVYSVCFYERIGFPHAYQITSLHAIANRTAQVTGRAISRPLRCRPGQFAFIKLPGFPSHPFTISRISGEEIEFTIRALGDHTSALVAAAGDTTGPDGARRIGLGVNLGVSRAHGRFDYTTGGRRQIWIAAGIGITPFHAFLCEGVPDQYDVDLYYSFSGTENAPFLGQDSLHELCPANVRLHCIDTRSQGRLSIDQVTGAAPEGAVSVYFCGPRAMRAMIKRALPRAWEFHADEFEFRPSLRRS